MPAVDTIREQALQVARPDVKPVGDPLGDKIRQDLQKTLTEKGARAALEDARNNVVKGLTDAKKQEVTDGSFQNDDGTAEWAAQQVQKDAAADQRVAAVDLVNPYLVDGYDTLGPAKTVLTDKVMDRLNSTVWLAPAYGGFNAAQKRTFAEELLKDPHFRDSVNRKLQDRAKPINDDMRRARRDELVAAGYPNDNTTYITASTQLEEELAASLNSVVEDTTTDYLRSALDDTDQFMTDKATDIDGEIQAELKKQNLGGTETFLQTLENDWNIAGDAGKAMVDGDYRALLQSGIDGIINNKLPGPANQALRESILNNLNLKKKVQAHVLRSLVFKRFRNGELSSQDLLSLGEAPWWGDVDGKAELTRMVATVARDRGTLDQAKANDILKKGWFEKAFMGKSRGEWTKMVMLLLLGLAVPLAGAQAIKHLV